MKVSFNQTFINNNDSFRKIDCEEDKHTYDPVGTFQQIPTLVFPPNFDARIHFYPTRDLLQNSLNAFHFGCAYISQCSGCMAVKRG